MFLKILGPVKAKRGVWQQFPKTQSCAAGGQHCGCPRTLLGRQKLLFSDDGFFYSMVGLEKLELTQFMTVK